MKANWYIDEGFVGVLAIYRGYTLRVTDAPGFRTEIFRLPKQVVEDRDGFDSLKYAQQWAESVVDFITENPTFDDVSDLGRLRQIQQEIGDLLDEAIEIVEEKDPLVVGRARAYWYPHIKIALGGEHEFMGQSMCSFQDTIDEMEES